MKQGELLAQSSLDGYRALGAFGQPVHQSYTQLRAAVAQRLDARCADLFARPQIDARAGIIRWVSPVAGTPRSWRSLSPQEQAEHALDLQIIRGQFDTYLAELRRSGVGDGGEAFASVLSQALQTPNDGHLHFVGDQPVMTFWGFTELDGSAFETLSAAPPAAPIADDGAGRRGFPVWLGWLLGLLGLLLLLLLLWWWFTRDDRPRAPVFPDRAAPERVIPADPVVDPVDPDGPAPEPRRVLRDRDGRVIDIGRLRVDREGRVIGPDGAVIDGVRPEDLGLAPGVDPALLPGEDAALPGEDGVAPGEDGVAPGEDGVAPGEDGVQPGEDGTAPGEDAAQPGEDGVAPGEDGVQPGEDGTAPGEDGVAPGEDGAQPGEDGATLGEPLTLPPVPVPNPGAEQQAAPIDFMRGRWRSRSALTDETGARIDQTYEFDPTGKGRSILRRADGTECTAPAEARMENGKLRIIEQDNPTCPDGRRFEKSETVCEPGASGGTKCSGQGYDVQIERVGD